MEYLSWNRSGLTTAYVALLTLLLTAMPLKAQGQTEALISRGVAAGIDAALLHAVDDRASESGLGSAERAAILSKGITLAEEGLPAEAVLHKALEGLAKHVPAPRVIAVMDRMQQQTVEAGRIIESWLSRPAARGLIDDDGGRGRAVLVENLAEALVHDVPRPAIDAVLDRLPEHARRSRFGAAEVGTALSVLADLPSTRHDPEATASLIVSALNAGYSPGEIRSLPLAIRAAEQRGDPITAEQVAGEIEKGTPADKVLEGLFGGDFPGRGIGPSGRAGGPPDHAGPPPGVGPDDAGKDRGAGRGQDNRPPRRDN